MSIYVITGISKGIGFEFTKQFSADSNNLVIGLVRSKASTEKKVAEDLPGRSNIKVITADLTNYASLKQAAGEVEKILAGRGIDYLLCSGGMVPYFDGFSPIGDLKDKPDELNECATQVWDTNVVGNIHYMHLFMPFVLKGKAKKVIALSTGLADLDLTNDVGIDVGALYAASKAAINVIMAKFSVQYKKDGVLFLSLSPGVVEVGHYDDISPEQAEGLMKFVGTLQSKFPSFKGPISTEESVKAMQSVWENADVEKDGGKFLSHLGTKQWV